jgi:hypothetical protein
MAQKYPEGLESFRYKPKQKVKKNAFEIICLSLGHTGKSIIYTVKI